MIDCRYQKNDKVNEFDQSLGKIVKHKIKVSVPLTLQKIYDLYNTYGIRDIDEEIQDSIYKRVNKL